MYNKVLQLSYVYDVFTRGGRRVLKKALRRAQRKLHRAKFLLTPKSMVKLHGLIFCRQAVLRPLFSLFYVSHLPEEIGFGYINF